MGVSLLTTPSPLPCAMGCNGWVQLSGDALERSPVLLSRFLTLRDVRSLLGKAEAALHASQGGEEITSKRVQVRCFMGCWQYGRGVHAAACWRDV
jgi:site-specific recombinase XerC